MSFDAEQKAALQAPLNRGHVKTRQQAGRALSYVEGWHAIAEANRIFGFDRWHRETIEMRQLGEPREVDGKFRIAYYAKVRIEVFAGEDSVIREGCGYGSGIDRDLGSAHESAIKEAETDAMKRALMTFGNPFGLALYDKTQADVADAAPAPKPEANVTTLRPAPQSAVPVTTEAERARKWAEMALVKIPTLGAGQFDAWHKNNRQMIADVRPLWPDLHAKLVATVNQAISKFNPIGA